jgi:adenine-specific DNA-methyltransferase
MKLPDNEIRDITQYLEQGKPLPDKYRFMLFGDDREIELVWSGKSHEVTNVVLPFQTIEHIDEPRPEAEVQRQPDLFNAGGRQLKGWTNKLIWGDNKFILSSLKNGPLREEIEANGGIKLIYIDPPFDVGADFTMDVEIGDETLSKDANVLEELAYRDTWGKGADSFIQMIFERIVLLKDLLAPDGSIFVHCDNRVNSYIRLILDEVFGADQYVNSISWKRSLPHGNTLNRFGQILDTIHFYRKSETGIWNQQYSPYSDDAIARSYRFVDEDTGRRYQTISCLNPNRNRPNLTYEWNGHTRVWKYTKERMQRMHDENLLVYSSSGGTRYKMYLDEAKGVPVQDLWNDLTLVLGNSLEGTGYPTQKPESMIRRIIESCSNSNDIICDFFVGSGTTAAVAEQLGRKWICSDLGKFSIHTSRKRLIAVQRELKSEGKNYRAFEVLNLGKYESQFFVSGLSDLDDKVTDQVENNREIAFNNLILQAYQAEPIQGFRTFRGKKNNRIVAIGPVNMPCSRFFAEEVVRECTEKGITKADLLAFEFEMGLFPNIQDDASGKGVDLVLKHIPKEVFDKRAVDRGEARFHDVAYIDVRPKFQGNSVAVELINYSVFYTQGITSLVEENLKSGKSQIVVENGQIIKISRDKNGLTNPRVVLTKNWHDWVDYWSIDFDFESKKEIIYERDEKTGEEVPKWTGAYIFENEWQSFRTRQERAIELNSSFWELPPGRRKIAIKVVDIFGNDTMKVIPVTIGGKI